MSKIYLATKESVDSLEKRVDDLTAADVGAVPTSRKINNKAMDKDIDLTASDVKARPETWMPSASDVGALPITGGTASGPITAKYAGKDGPYVRAASEDRYVQLNAASSGNVGIWGSVPGKSSWLVYMDSNGNISMPGQANTATKLSDAKTIGVNLASGTAANFDGSTNITPGVYGTLGVGNGGTGVNSFTAGEALIGNGAGAIQTRAITHNTAVLPISVDTNLFTQRTLANWNGAYTTSGTSNLTYCNQGKFGSIVTKNTGDYLPITGGTFTGPVHFTRAAGTTPYIRVTSGSNADDYIQMSNIPGGNRGLYAQGAKNSWLVYMDASGNVALPGNANTATKLATARQINGVAFDGSQNIDTRWKTGDTFTSSTSFPLSGFVGGKNGSGQNSIYLTLNVGKSINANGATISTFAAGLRGISGLINGSNNELNMLSLYTVGCNIVNKDAGLLVISLTAAGGVDNAPVNTPVTCYVTGLTIKFT